MCILLLYISSLQNSQLLAINLSSSERMIIFFPWLLKFSHVCLFYNFHGCALSYSWVGQCNHIYTLSRMSGFLWCCSKWACQFGHFLQNMSGIQVSACSLDTDPNYVTTMPQLQPSLNHQVFGCILRNRYYVIPAALSDASKTLL